MSTFKIIKITPASPSETQENYKGQQNESGAWADSDGSCWWDVSTPVFGDTLPLEQFDGSKTSNPRSSTTGLILSNGNPYHLSAGEGTENYRRIRILQNGVWYHISEQTNPKPSIITQNIDFSGLAPGQYQADDGVVTKLN